MSPSLRRYTTLASAVLMVAVPVTAQNQPAGTFAQNGEALIRSSMSQAVDRFVADEGLRRQTVDNSDWSAVRRLERGDKIILTSQGGTPAIRYVLAVDDVEIFALNVTDSIMPSPAADAVLTVLEDHPVYFWAVLSGERVQLSKTVRLTPEGLWMTDRKIADLRQVLECVPRADVAEISLYSKHIRPHVLRGMLIGAIVGGVFLSSGQGGSWSTGDKFALGAFFGTGFGAGYGAIVGAAAPTKPDVIYRGS